MSEATDPEVLRADAARHRAQLADTIEELAAKTDVKARVRKRAAAVTEQATDAGRAVAGQFSGPPAAVARRPLPWALVGAVVAGAVVGWLVWRRRS